METAKGALTVILAAALALALTVSAHKAADTACDFISMREHGTHETVR